MFKVITVNALYRITYLLLYDLKDNRNPYQFPSKSAKLHMSDG